MAFPTPLSTGARLRLRRRERWLGSSERRPMGDIPGATSELSTLSSDEGPGSHWPLQGTLSRWLYIRSSIARLHPPVRGSRPLIPVDRESDRVLFVHRNSPGSSKFQMPQNLRKCFPRTATVSARMTNECQVNGMPG